MRSFDKEDYKKVSKYEKDFTRAIESRYCTGLSQEELQVIHTIYRETLNRQANLTCGACILQMMTSVGRLYFNYKKVEDEKRLKNKTRKRNTGDESSN